MSGAPYREPDAPAPPPPQTVEGALGQVLTAMHGLTDDQKERVLLAAAALYGLDVGHDDGEVVHLGNAERVAELVRGPR